jgi:deazaflavin-dependent oxidoreductase (nitroreductase family)
MLMANPFRNPAPGSIWIKIVNAATEANVWLYRRTGGRRGGKVKGAPVLLLEHVGRKSGRARTTPVLYLADGDDLVLVASKGGADKDPAWWLNLKSNPDTTVEIGREHRRVHAREATPDERRALWPRLVAMYGDFAVYQARTVREIPVVILSPGT